MDGARAARVLEETEAFDSEIYVVDGFAGSEDCGAERRESDADEIGAGENQGGFAIGGDADNAAAAMEAGGEVDVALF